MQFMLCRNFKHKKTPAKITIGYASQELRSIYISIVTFLSHSVKHKLKNFAPLTDSMLKFATEMLAHLTSPNRIKYNPELQSIKNTERTFYQKLIENLESI